MSLEKHPREILEKDTITTIRENTFEIEQAGKLNKVVLQLIEQKDALRILVPKECGGQAWALPQTVAFFEALAWADGNVGWLVNLGAGANMFAGYMQQTTASELFKSPETWCAGSGAASGKAFKTKGGYTLSGRWKYASGAAHATYFTANALLFDEDKRPNIQEDGTQAFLSFLFMRDETTVYDSWKVTGLKATSSNDFSADNLFVPDERTFSLIKPSNFATAPIYRFPFDVLAVVNMACMPTGMALHFIDLFRTLVVNKKPLYSDKTLQDHSKIMETTEKSIASFLDARIAMYDALEQAWQPYEKGDTAEQKQLDELIHTSKQAAQLARQVVFDLYPICGMNMVFAGSELNKVWQVGS